MEEMRYKLLRKIVAGLNNNDLLSVLRVDRLEHLIHSTLPVNQVYILLQIKSNNGEGLHIPRWRKINPFFFFSSMKASVKLVISNFDKWFHFFFFIANLCMSKGILIQKRNLLLFFFLTTYTSLSTVDEPLTRMV